MKATLFDRARAERFARLLEEASGARRRHARSRLDQELAGPVEIGRALTAMRLDASPTAEFRAGLRAQLIATAEREGIGVKASPSKRRGLRKRIRATRPRARGAIVVGIAAGTLALSGVSVASGEAIPGDTLYGMKRSTERAQLALAGSDASRGQLYLDFARTRLEEALALRSSEANFVGALHDMDDETLLGARTLITSAVNQRETGVLDAIDRFVVGQRLLVTTLLKFGIDNAGRSKVNDSLELLKGVELRVKSARTAIGCGAASTGADAFGPILAACTASHRAQSAPAASVQRSAQPQTATVGVPQPAMSPTAAFQPEKEEGRSLLDELGRILSGLLG